MKGHSNEKRQRNMTTAIQQKEREGIKVKTTTPDNFLKDMFNAFDAISRRAFEIFESNGHLNGHDTENWFKAENELFHPVHIEVNETDESISVKAEVPGFNEEELQVTVGPNRLTISGKRESSKKEKEKRGKTVYSETCSDEIFRVVELPAEVDAEKATATLRVGVLQLRVPKAAKARIEPVYTKSAA